MATTTTRINGSTTQADYGFYINVIVDDTIQNDNTFLVNIDAYIVNNGSRTNTNGWDKQTIIQGIGQQTDTNQSLNTTNADRYGGETLAIRHYGIYRVPITTSQIYVTGAMARNGGYASYDPGYCEAKGYVSMPRVQSVWSSSLLSISNIESAFTLPITKYVSSYYNVVEVRNSNNTTLIKTIDNAVNGTSVTFSSSELNSIYAIDNNRNQLPLVFYMDLKTYTNSSKTTQIGTTQRLKCEAYIVNGNPTFTYTAVETNQAVIDVLGANPDTVIENFSQILFTISVTTKNGANVSSVKVNNTSATLQSGSYKATIVPISEFNGITVTDSRGLIADQTVQLYTCPYVLPKINAGWNIKRTSPISPDLVLNATINAYNDYLGQNHLNSVTVEYSLDNSTWVTIPSSSYTYSNYLITITDFEINNAIPYTQEGRFYLRATDLLTQSNENYRISKGVETYSWGENDLQVNGEIYLADVNGENAYPMSGSIIIDYGSNANGTYIKYANGIMICTKEISDSVAMTSAWSTLYEGSIACGSWAKEFLSVPNVQVTNASATGALIECFNPLPSKTSAGTLWMARPNSTTQTVNINLLAIGKWK